MPGSDPTRHAATATPPDAPATGATAAGDGVGVVRPRRWKEIVGQWPLLLALVVLWCAVWEDFSLDVALAGLLFSLLITVLFPMPSIPFSGRLHPWWTLVFTARFLGDVVTSSLEVSRVVLTKGHTARSSIVGVRLRSHDDLVITLVSHALALVPGSIVLDVDRADAVLYLHVLNATTDEGVEAFRSKALRVEAAIILAVGTRDDVALVRRYPDSAPPHEETAGNRRHPVFTDGPGIGPLADARDHGKAGA